VTEPTSNGKHNGATAEEIAGLVGAERTAGEYVPVPDATQVPDADTVLTSGDAAIAAAEQRAALTRGRNLSDVPPLPIPADTANVRSGPEVNPACLSLLPLVGVWRGTGLFGNDPVDMPIDVS